MHGIGLYRANVDNRSAFKKKALNVHLESLSETVNSYENILQWLVRKMGGPGNKKKNIDGGLLQGCELQ